MMCARRAGIAQDDDLTIPAFDAPKVTYVHLFRAAEGDPPESFDRQNQTAGLRPQRHNAALKSRAGVLLPLRRRGATLSAFSFLAQTLAFAALLGAVMLLFLAMPA